MIINTWSLVESRLMTSPQTTRYNQCATVIYSRTSQFFPYVTKTQNSRRRNRADVLEGSLKGLLESYVTLKHDSFVCKQNTNATQKWNRVRSLLLRLGIWMLKTVFLLPYPWKGGKRTRSRKALFSFRSGVTYPKSYQTKSLGVLMQIYSDIV